MKLKLADTYLKLGEIGMETGIAYVVVALLLTVWWKLLPDIYSLIVCV